MNSRETGGRLANRLPIPRDLAGAPEPIEEPVPVIVLTIVLFVAVVALAAALDPPTALAAITLAVKL